MSSTPVQTWTRRFGIPYGTDFATSVTVGTDGAIYVAGTTSGRLDGQPFLGGREGFLTKYMPDGTKSWTVLSGTSSQDQFVATSGSGGSIYVAATVGDPILSKYLADGSKAWTNQLDATDSRRYSALTTGADGAIFVAGNTYGNLDGQVNAGLNDAFVAKYTPDGTKVWSRLFGTNVLDEAFALTTGTDGAVYVAGLTLGSLDGQIGSQWGSGFITKYTADGTKVWTRLSGTSAFALTTGADGGIYLAGSTRDSMDGQAHNGGDGDAFLVKYNPDGTKAWTRLLGSPERDRAYALTTGVDGTIYMAMDSYGRLDGGTEAYGRYLARYRPDGTYLDLMRLNVGNTMLLDGEPSLATGADGAIYVAGGSNVYSPDAFLTRVDPVAGVYTSPTYSISSTGSFDEGTSAVFMVTTTFVSPGTSFTYTVSGVSPGDISGAMTGTATLGVDGKATITIPIVADHLLEGQEVMTVAVPGDAATVLIPDSSVCLLAGTIIDTSLKEVRVEHLQVHDLVKVTDGTYRRVLWIGRQRRTPKFARFQGYLPVKISAGALDDNVPIRDLYLSPDHAVLVDGHLIHAKALVNGKTIVQMTEWAGDIEYYHIETEAHEIIYAEGVPCETFIDNVSRRQFDNYDEYEAMFGDERVMTELDLPRVKFKRQLPQAIAQRLEVRAQALAIKPKASDA